MCFIKQNIKCWYLQYCIRILFAIKIYKKFDAFIFLLGFGYRCYQNGSWKSSSNNLNIWFMRIKQSIKKTILSFKCTLVKLVQCLLKTSSKRCVLMSFIKTTFFFSSSSELNFPRISSSWINEILRKCIFSYLLILFDLKT